MNVEEITEKAIELAEVDEVHAAIEELLKLPNVGITTASITLAREFPDTFPVIDRKILTQIGNQDWLNNYLDNSYVYEMFTSHMRKKAAEAGLNIQKYRALLFDK